MSLAAAGLVAAIYISMRNTRHLRAEGLVWLQALRALITHLQHHRGLTSGVVGGDASLQAQLEDVQIQISLDFGAINSLGAWIKQHELWQYITQHWARLARNIYQLPVTRSIDQHNRLIRSTLLLVDEVAARFHLQVDHGGHLWRDLLSLAEDLGHVRALGTAIAAGAGKMAMLEEARARDSLQKSLRAVARTLNLPRCQAKLNSEEQSCMIEFLAYTDAHLLHGSPQVAAADFYAAATAVVDVVYTRFDAELLSMARRLNP